MGALVAQARLQPKLTQPNYDCLNLLKILPPTFVKTWKCKKHGFMTFWGKDVQKQIGKGLMMHRNPQIVRGITRKMKSTLLKWQSICLAAKMLQQNARVTFIPYQRKLMQLNCDCNKSFKLKFNQGLM